MTEIKTKPSKASVEAFIASISDEGRRSDCVRLAELMQAITGDSPRMWGPGIVGFGSFSYKGKGGREGDWFLCGFAARKKALTVYVNAYLDNYLEHLGALGAFTTGKSCIYVKRLSDIDESVLVDLLTVFSKDLKSGKGMGC